MPKALLFDVRSIGRMTLRTKGTDMQKLTLDEANAALSGIGNTAGRDALVAAMRESKAEAARFTADELAAFGIAKGKKYTLKGSKSGAIRVARTEADGTLLVILNAHK